MSKPEVQYVDIGTRPVVGLRAHVYLKKHHTVPLRQDGDWIFTSAVQRILRDTAAGPVFETYNTIYKPCPTDAMPAGEATRLREHA